MNTKIVGLIVGLAVAILLVGSLLMPVINDYNDTTMIKYNNAEDTLSKVETEVSEVEVESFDPLTITVNGEIYNGDANKILFMSDKVLINGYLSDIAMHIDNGDGTMTNYAGLSALKFIVDGQSNTITVYFSNASVTDQTITVNYGDWGYCMDPVGDYSAIVVWRNVTVYLNDLDQMHLVNSRYTGAYVSGTGDQVRIGTETQTATVKTNTIDNVENLIYLNLTTAADTSDYQYQLPDDTPVEARYIVVPLVVYGEKIPEHDWASMLYVLPFIVLASLIAIGASTLFRRY